MEMFFRNYGVCLKASNRTGRVCNENGEIAHKFEHQSEEGKICTKSMQSFCRIESLKTRDDLLCKNECKTILWKNGDSQSDKREGNGKREKL